MYNVEDAQNVMQHFTPCDYNSVYEICPGLKVRFVDAGHLLGSSSIEMWVTEENVTKKIVFSGDIGNHNRPLIKDPQYVDSADYVVMESTYGNRCLLYTSHRHFGLYVVCRKPKVSAVYYCSSGGSCVCSGVCHAGRL